MTKIITLKACILMLACTLIFGVDSYAQSGSGEVKGLISDVAGGLPGARVTVYQGGIVKFQGKTDMDGKYSIKPIPVGNYELEASFVGVGTKKVEFYMALDGVETVNIQLGDEKGQDVKQLDEAVVSATGILQTGSPPSRDIIDAKQIQNRSSRSTSDFADMSGSVLSGKKGDTGAISLDGGRNENTVYIIDGIIVRGSRNVNLPIGSISSMEVMSSGIPAKYGDATGGVITLTTKGISRKTQGGIYLERSVEGFGHNQVSFNVSGPFISKYDDKVGASRPVAGYFIAADYINNKDGNPNYYKNKQLSPERIADLEANPLTQSITGGQRLQKRAELVTADDFVEYKYRPNARSQSGQLVSKLDFMPSLQTNITVGFQLNYSQYNAWSRSNSLMNPSNNPLYNNYTGRTYLRFTQRVKNDENNENPRVSNLYFTGQLSYQRDFLGTENPFHRDDFFQYGYVGRFEEIAAPEYRYGTDEASGVSGMRMVSPYAPNGLLFSRSESNPILANFTSFAYQNGDLRSVQDVLNYGGLRNGDNPGTAQLPYISNVGQQTTTYSRARSDQTGFNLESGFTLKPGKGNIDHNIEVGFLYEQRVDRAYTLGASGLWNNIRLSVNSHIQDLDLENPIFRVNGEDYTYEQYQNGEIGVSALDTINYNRKYVADKQSFFDKNLRKKLGLAVDGTDYIQVDALDPSLLSLDMFSADDLFNQGQNYVVYNGYDHIGNRNKGRVSFNDFFLQKDENGNYTRAIDAFRPVYFAGYIMDKFQFKDINFSLGLRLDRYDANTKVMRDPYSLYGVRYVGELTNGTYTTLGDIGIPDNIEPGFVPYVGDNQSDRPIIAGYRNGDIWYDPYGRVVDDPKVLQDNYTGGSNNLEPYLQNKDDEIQAANEEMLNRSFIDYKPQVTLSPRMQFSFPINDMSQVYAHYDVVVQRPKGGGTGGIGNINFLNPLDYYYFEQNTANYIANPNLKPERMIEYEVGFQQVIDEKSRTVLTLSTFYKERKDQITVRPYLYAFPKTYNTYGNRDFSTSKGVRVKFKSSLTKYANLIVNYQFGTTTGTGSSTTSQLSLINSGQGSLRPTAFYLNNDVRHRIKINLYSEIWLKDDDNWFRKFVNGFNFNLSSSIISGRPFTKYARPFRYGNNQTGNPIVGTLNGTRLPWNFNVDLKVSRDIVLRKGVAASEDIKAKPPVVINIFSYVQNIFNIRNVLGAYGYTGSPDDDGFLSSSLGRQTVSILPEIQQQSYIDMYNWLLYNQPGFFNTPRQIVIGLNYNF